MILFIQPIFLYGIYTFVRIFFGALFGIKQNLCNCSIFHNQGITPYSAPDPYVLTKSK